MSSNEAMLAIDTAFTEEDYTTNEEEAQAKRKTVAEAGYGPDSDLWNVLLVVEDHHLHVNKEILMLSSPVFRQLFNSSFKETQTAPCTVDLPEKPIQTVLWLLDYLYPNKTFDVTDQNAVKLLPLAHEYQIEPLMKRCESVLMKQRNPRLEIIALAEKFELSSLLSGSIKACAKRLDYYNIDRQRRNPVNQALTDKSMLLIYESKVKQARETIRSVDSKLRTLSRKTFGRCETTCPGSENRSSWRKDVQEIQKYLDENNNI